MLVVRHTQNLSKKYYIYNKFYNFLSWYKLCLIHHFHKTIILFLLYVNYKMSLTIKIKKDYKLYNIIIFIAQNIRKLIKTAGIVHLDLYQWFFVAVIAV